MQNIANRWGLNANVLKVIAVIAMILDHAAYWWVPEESNLYFILRSIGRIVAPIMCYFIAEGFAYTSNKKKYLARMFVFAIVSHFPYVLYFDMDWWSGTSVIWTLFLGLLALTILKADKLPIIAKGCFILLCLWLARNADWNYIGVLWILGFGIFRGNKLLQMLSFVVIGGLFYLLPGYLEEGTWISFRLGMFLAIPFLALYSGARGRKSKLIKWGFYIIYPVHLLVLFFLRNMM